MLGKKNHGWGGGDCGGILLFGVEACWLAPGEMRQMLVWKTSVSGSLPERGIGEINRRAHRHTELSGGRSTTKSHDTFETEDFSKESLIPSTLLLGVGGGGG